MIKLETDRIMIRDYQKDEFELYYRLLSDNKTMYYLQDIKQHSRKEAIQIFHNVLIDQESEKSSN